MTPFSIYIHRQQNRVRCEEICPGIIFTLKLFSARRLNSKQCTVYYESIYKKNLEVGVGVDRLVEILELYSLLIKSLPC